jgi:hypothetical protein
MNKSNAQSLTDLKRISDALVELYNTGGHTYRALAQACSLSTNSVKTILEGKNANIVNYDVVARAMGSSLVEVITKLKPVQAGSVGATLRPTAREAVAETKTF